MELRCPKCKSRQVYTRIRKNQRVCRECGYVGDPQEFETNPQKEGEK